jgi:hypothetical protein
MSAPALSLVARPSSFWETTWDHDHSIGTLHHKAKLSDYNYNESSAGISVSSTPATTFLAPVQQHKHLSSSTKLKLTENSHLIPALPVCRSNMRQYHTLWLQYQGMVCWDVGLAVDYVQACRKDLAFPKRFSEGV